MANANLKARSDFSLGVALWNVLVHAHGSVNATAITMGNTDPSFLRRQVLDGTLPIKKLFEADDRALADFGDFLLEHFGQSRKTKSQMAREKLLEALAAFLDLTTEDK